MTDPSGSVRQRLQGLPSLWEITDALLGIWPDHAGYLDSRFTKEESQALKRLDEVAALARTIIGDDLALFCRDYQWMCDNFNEEQYHFAKTGRYRLSRFSEARALIYDNAPYMSRYVRGILLSQLFWRNHSAAMDHFRTRFLPANGNAYRHLEIGPGHGLFLYFVARDPRAGEIAAWDVSRSSLEATRQCLASFGVLDRVELQERDILATAPPLERSFDSILISEVLEHLEDPESALKTLKAVLVKDGRMLVNVPVNSPAPDHIYLWSNFAQVDATLRSAGLTILDREYYPVTGYSVQQAIDRRLSISCVITCR